MLKVYKLVLICLVELCLTIHSDMILLLLIHMVWSMKIGCLLPYAVTFYIINENKFTNRNVLEIKQCYHFFQYNLKPF